MMRILIFVLALGFTGAANAKGQMAVAGTFGFFSGGINYFGDIKSGGGTAEGNTSGTISGMFNIGAEFEYRLNKKMGVSGLFRYMNTSDDLQANTETTYSLFVLGGLWRHFLRAGKTEFSMGAGLGYMGANIKASSSGSSSETDESGVFGPMFLIGATYDISKTFALGVEQGTYYALGETWNGVLASEWNVKGVFKF